MRLLFALPLLLLAACSSTPAPTPEPDAYTWLSNEPRTARFVQLVDRANLGDTLRSGRFLTVLAPTNDALATLGLTDPARIAAYPVDSARRLVLVHILATQRARTNFETGTPYATRLRDASIAATVEATTTSPGFSINASSVVQADQFARNATLHLLSQPLTPPLRAGTLWDALQADASSSTPRFARLRAALARAQSAAGARLDTLLQNPNQRLLLLAPTDAAFGLAGYPDNASIQAASPAALYTLLDGHIGSEARFTDRFTGPLPGTIASAFPNAGAILLSSAGTPSASLQQPFNARARNGVFHAVTRVFLP